MAKVEGPLFSQDASGKQGALVYARNPYGLYTRAAPGAAGAPSAEQTAWRNAMSAVYTTWETDAGITPARRAQWMDFARAWPVRDRWGRRIYLDAARWFCKFSIHRQRKGLGLHPGPPIDPSCAYYPTLTFTQEPWGIVVDASPRPTGDQMICLSRVAAQSTNRNFCPTRRMYVDHLTAANEWPYLVWKNGDLDVAEKRYFFVYRIIDGSGRPSSQQIDYVDAERWTAGWTRVADEDVRCLEDTPAVNYGGDIWLQARGVGGVRSFSLLSWDLSEIPEAALVSSASVFVWCDVMWVGGDVGGHKGLNEWGEYQATWNERLTGVNWGVAGGQGGVDFLAGAEDVTLVNLVDQWYSWDVPVMVGEWIADGSVNFGVWLRWADGVVSVLFRSRDWGVPGERPYISIVFGS